MAGAQDQSFWLALDWDSLLLARLQSAGAWHGLFKSLSLLSIDHVQCHSPQGEISSHCTALIHQPQNIYFFHTNFQPNMFHVYSPLDTKSILINKLQMCDFVTSSYKKKKKLVYWKCNIIYLMLFGGRFYLDIQVFFFRFFLFVLKSEI